MDLALLGNGSFQILIDSRARVQWLCWPRFDSSFVIGPLLDQDKGGEFSILPADEGFEVEQNYLSHTAIVETVWSTPTESFSVTDFAPRFRDEEGVQRPRCFIRRVRALRGSPRVQLRYRAVYDYGRSQPDPGLVHLQSSKPIEPGQDIELHQDLYLVLSWQEEMAGDIASRCEGLLEQTRRYWMNWSASLRETSLYTNEVIRSAITLKLHQYGDTGAFTAAATTSIPEHAHSGRNWDYRFCWPRDTYFSVDALWRLGSKSESEAFVDFLLRIAGRGDSFQPLYGIAGERHIEEFILEHLKGYRGDGPVRIGNAAYMQDQHDIYGEMICAIEPVYRLSPSSQVRELLMHLLRQIEMHFEDADAGLWEKRNEPARHTFSLLMHWLGASAMWRLGQDRDDDAMSIAAKEIMDRARLCIDSQCWNEQEGFYTETVGGKQADASLLFMINVGYLSADDPRAERHLLALSDRLQGAEGLLLRYRHDDGLGETHSSFTVCTLWYAEALAWLGKHQEAADLLDAVLARANHVGLLSEDIDPVDGSLWGNFPQTYSHAGIIRCSLALSALRGLERPVSTTQG